MASPGPASAVVLVRDGEALVALAGAHAPGQVGGALVVSGVGRRLGPAVSIGVGDALVSARLTLDALDGTAASVVINGTSHFGFDGRRGELFVEGPLFGGATRGVGRAAEHITPGEPFVFEVERSGGVLRCSIDGEVVHEQADDGGALGTVALRPHRGTMRVLDWRVDGALTAVERQELIDVFVAGDDGYHTFRIPAVVRAGNGDLLAFAEGRVDGSGDSGNIDLVMKRSTDGGATWGEMRVIGDFGEGCIGNPAPVVDAASGDVVLLAVLQPAGVHEGGIRGDVAGDGPGYRDPCVLRSSDHGETWSDPVSLVETADRADWRWYATGPCHGIQLQHGEHAGRLVVPANFSVVGSGGNDHLGAHALLSDDGGRTWRIGAVDDTHVGDDTLNPNESTVVELADGRLMFNARDQGGSSRATRAVAYSEDGGETFVGPYAAEEQLVAPVCQGALLGVDTDAGRVVVFSGPGAWDGRRRMQLRYSTDAGATWRAGPVLHAGSAAYSDLVALDGGEIGCLFEVDGYGRIVFARVPVPGDAGEG